MRITAALVVGLLTSTLAAGAQEDEVDFSELITPTCQLVGLVATPPEGWFNVPIEGTPEELAGCQMMRVNDQEELVGLMRLLSKKVPATTPEDTWTGELLTLEIAALERMGVTLGEPMWKRDDVPVTGPGFESGRAAGFAAKIEGNPIPQEVHILTFGRPTTKYLVTLSSPGREVEGGAYYQSNTQDFGTLIQTLQFPTGEP